MLQIETVVDQVAGQPNSQGTTFVTPGMPTMGLRVSSGQVTRFSNEFNPAFSFIIDSLGQLADNDTGDDGADVELRSMELGPRDRLSQAFVKELEKGRTVDTPYGAVVYLDLRHLGEKKINAKIPFVRELCTKYQNLDPVRDLIPVRPVVHYMMGGVHTDMNGATPLPGLYAAGEVACVSINGANRLGSNSLTECLVFGARAGIHAEQEFIVAGQTGTKTNRHIIKCLWKENLPDARC